MLLIDHLIPALTYTLRKYDSPRVCQKIPVVCIVCRFVVITGGKSLWNLHLTHLTTHPNTQPLPSHPHPYPPPPPPTPTPTPTHPLYPLPPPPTPWTKWPLFRKRYFRMHFHEWKVCKISMKFVTKGPIDNNQAMIQIMDWRRIGDKPLSESMLTWYTDAYMWC